MLDYSNLYAARADDMTATQRRYVKTPVSYAPK
jgi:hypothetical protein